MVEAGTLITCSWQNIFSPMEFVKLLSDMDVEYQLDLALGITTGMGLLNDTVGWLGEDMLFVYINKTEMRQMSTYICVARTVDDYDWLWSNMFELTVNGKNILHYRPLSRKRHCN